MSRAAGKVFVEISPPLFTEDCPVEQLVIGPFPCPRCRRGNKRCPVCHGTGKLAAKVLIEWSSNTDATKAT